ncbi:MAG: hypothetical protein O3A63_15150 [Proteobacteria bacterium]|nr:hypothetical protein [Pseudomonadota bacterium]
MLVLPFFAVEVAAQTSATTAPNNFVQNAPGLSVEEATAIARRQTGGRVLSAAPDGKNGYRVRVLLDGGRVTTVIVPDEKPNRKAP